MKTMQCNIFSHYLKDNHFTNPIHLTGSYKPEPDDRYT